MVGWEVFERSLQFPVFSLIVEPPVGEVGGESGVGGVSDWAAFWRKESADALRTLLDGVTFDPSVNAIGASVGENGSVGV